MSSTINYRPTILTAIVSSATVSGDNQLALAAGFILHDIASHGAGCNGVRACQIHLSRTAASREIAVLGADHDLVRTRRNSRTRIDAGAATWLDHDRSCTLESFQITIADAILPRLLGAKLNIKLAGIRNTPSLAQCIGEHLRIHIHVGVFSRGARAAVRDLYRHRSIQVTNKFAISGITGSR